MLKRLLSGAVLSLILLISANAQQLILPGDYPDPSVVKIGDSYWASATTSNWMPAYPLLKSKDLVNWETKAFVFEKKPDWVDFYFWAPEISYDNGKVYIYYSAHKKDGNLCVGIASADKPEGPYKDHGALICQPVGSIDAFPMRDENGKLHLIWKEDGNSVKKPTPIWISEINEERTALVGEKKELFRNDQAWERNLVEGVSMMKHGEYFYAFYAAAGCCGPKCNYISGIARSKSLMGPWEKYDKNPVLADDEKWKCPGHGTPVEKDGKYYFMYHAYEAKSHQYAGRQGLLIEFKFNNEGWIDFVKEDKPDAKVDHLVREDFSGRKISDKWQWSVFQDLQYHQRSGRMSLNALPAPGRFIGQKVLAENFTAEAEVKVNKSSAEAGIAAIGDEKNLISVTAKDALISVVAIRNGKPATIIERNFIHKGKVYLRMEVFNGTELCFSYSTDKKNYIRVTEKNLDSSYLPPWDRAVRAGIISKGTADQVAVFDSFWLNSQ